MLDFGVYTHIFGVKKCIATISYQLLSYLVLAVILNFNMAANQNHVFSSYLRLRGTQRLDFDVYTHVFRVKDSNRNIIITINHLVMVLS
jgi:hypothetical protein